MALGAVLASANAWAVAWVLGLQGELMAMLATLAAAAGQLLSLHLLVAAVTALGLYAAYSLLARPLMLVRGCPEVGYITKPGQSKADRAQEVQRRRLKGDLPPVYPNGWYELIRASDLKPGMVHQVTALGREMCVFRGESGGVGVLDAYCPHLGANLAAGGTVEGDCVQCPFHGWKFNPKGDCVGIPYSKEIPHNAKTKSYTSLEINDQILIWFDAEGREPMWQPPTIEGIATGAWTYRGTTRHIVNAHIQEVPENAADVAHLNYLHSPALLDGTDLRKTHRGLFKFVEHRWNASWGPNEPEDEKHLSVLDLFHFITVFGVHIPLFDLRVKAVQTGPSLVYLYWSCPFGKGVFVQSLLPEEPILQILTHRVYAEYSVPTIVAKFFMAGEAAQVERDVMVWNNKRYRSKPVLAKEDHLIARHRRWYSQFYSESSPRIDDVDSLEW